MSETVTTFNPAKYKQTTRSQWDTAAEAWHRWQPLLSEWLGPATEIMFDLAEIEKGHSVLDVAAGAGDQSIAAAKRVGTEGKVLATDLSPEILKFAAELAKKNGHQNVETKVIDGESLTDLKPGIFDAVISRVGLIYFPDQQKALLGMKHALKEGGKVAAIVYSTADKNGFFSIPVSVIRKRAALPPPLPGQPGPFSLGSGSALSDALKNAGFHDVKSQVINAPVQLKSSDSCLQFEKESFGALHQMLSGLSDEEKNEAWKEIARELKKFENDNGFEGPCELVVAVGTK